jgi:hypothetical protein
MKACEILIVEHLEATVKAPGGFAQFFWNLRPTVSVDLHVQPDLRERGLTRRAPQ